MSSKKDSTNTKEILREEERSAGASDSRTASKLPASHTPGPWCVDARAPWLVRDAKNGLVAQASQQDAPVIAASPDMFAVIEEYLDWGAMTGSDRDLFEQKFRAAIAKAVRS